MENRLSVGPQHCPTDTRHDMAASTGDASCEHRSVVGRVAAVLLAVPDVDRHVDHRKIERPPPHGQDGVAGVAGRALSESLIQGLAISSLEHGILVHR